MKTSGLFILLMVWCIGWLPAGAQENDVPRFEPAPCPVEFAFGRAVECGYLVVPEEHANPDGTAIRVMLAIFRTDASAPQPDPLIFLAGGPGSNTLTVMTQGLGGYLNQALENRDVIIVDQRGMGFSEPSLNCLEIDALYERPTMSSNVSDTALTEQAARQCFDHLVNEGVNIGAFNTVESAGDVAAIPEALGYEQINIYGGSYGSTLAMTVMRNYPDRIRSVMLQGITPPQVDLMASFAPDFEHTLNMLLESCAADDACSTAFPDLETMFYAVVERLNAQPLTVTVTNPLTNAPTAFTVNGNDFIRGIQSAFYNSDFLPQFPALVAAFYNGQYGALNNLIINYLTSGLFGSEGANYAMRCMDDVMTTTSAIWEESVASVHPALQAAFRGDITQWDKLCASWGLRQLDPVENTPVVSDIPTLILNGAYDPVTPAAWGALAMETLSNGYNYTFPNDGHGVNPGRCALKIFDAFITDPTTAPDAQCLDEIPAMRFVVR